MPPSKSVATHQRPQRWLSHVGFALTLGVLCACHATTQSTTGPVSLAQGTVVDSPRAYMALTDGSIHLATEGDPTGLYVIGVIEAGRFIPEGDVLGDGPLATSGAPGWLELLDGNFYSNETNREPARPYVSGAMDADGVFRPSDRRVNY